MRKLTVVKTAYMFAITVAIKPLNTNFDLYSLNFLRSTVESEKPSGTTTIPKTKTTNTPFGNDARTVNRFDMIVVVAIAIVLCV